MQKPKFNLDREFVRWFYEEIYPDLGSNRAQVFGHFAGFNPDQKDYWMRQAYKAGAEAMWQDIDYTLAQYACAVEGCDPEFVAPAEVFDRARENLWGYLDQLKLF